jgi:hypothetical protein
MSNRTDLMQQMNRLKREERTLKMEKLEIRRATAVKDQREPLARNHEKRKKNKRQQSLVMTELRNEPAPAAPGIEPTMAPSVGPTVTPIVGPTIALIVDPTIAPANDNESPTLPPSPRPPPGDSSER